MDTRPTKNHPPRIPPPTLLAIRELARPFLPELEPGDIYRRLTVTEPGAEPRAEPERGKLLSVRQAAARLSCSRSIIFALLRKGKLSRVKLGTRSTRIPEDSVAALAGKGGAQ